MAIAMTKADAAYVELRSAILDGTLQPGSLLDQGLIAERLGISTTPVREALRRLEAEHLVVAEAHRDAIVARLSLDELHHLYAVRLVLDPLAARLAAQEADSERLSRIEALAMPDSGGALAQVRANREFHRLIYTASGNPILGQTLDSLWNRCDRYRFLLVESPDEPLEDLEEHHEIAGQLRNRNAEACYSLMHSHVSESYKKLAKLAERQIASSAPALSALGRA